MIFRKVLTYLNAKKGGQLPQRHPPLLKLWRTDSNTKNIAKEYSVLGTPYGENAEVFRGKRMTSGGRRSVRSRLFMPTLVAVRYNPVLKRYYLRLVEKEGKCKMVVIVAAMRKLLCIMNTMLKKNQNWQPNFVKTA